MPGTSSRVLGPRRAHRVCLDHFLAGCLQAIREVVEIRVNATLACGRLCFALFILGAYRLGSSCTSCSDAKKPTAAAQMGYPGTYGAPGAYGTPGAYQPPAGGYGQPYGGSPYGTPAPGYGAGGPPAYGAQPDPYGAPAPAYGAQPDPYGAPAPAYGAQPDPYGAAPPAAAPAVAAAPAAPYASQPEPGWLPDPTGRHQLRYWTGANWTDSVSDGGATENDPYTG